METSILLSGLSQLFSAADMSSGDFRVNALCFLVAVLLGRREELLGAKTNRKMRYLWCLYLGAWLGFIMTVSSSTNIMPVEMEFRVLIACVGTSLGYLVGKASQISLVRRKSVSQEAPVSAESLSTVKTEN